MLHIGNLDLDKFGQLMNAVIHKLADKASIATNNTSVAQVAYGTAEKRIMYFDGTEIRQIATLKDISASGNKIIVAEIDPYVPTANVVEGDGWFKKSTNTLQIRTNTGWEPVTSAVSIPSWAANTDFTAGSLIIQGGQIYQNTTGTTNNDAVWTPGNWTQIGGATLSKNTLTITPAILDTQTVANVTRTDKTYRLNHGLGATNLLVRIKESNKEVYTTITDIDANNIDLTFNTAAQDSGKTYTVLVVAV